MISKFAAVFIGTTIATFSTIGHAEEIGIGYADFDNDVVYRFSIEKDQIQLRQCAGVVESKKSCVDKVQKYSIPLKQFTRGDSRHGNYRVSPDDLQRAIDAQNIARDVGDEKAVAKLQANIDALTNSLKLMDMMRKPLTIKKLVLDADFQEIQFGFIRVHSTYFGARCDEGTKKMPGIETAQWGLVNAYSKTYGDCGALGLACIYDNSVRNGLLCQTMLACDQGTWYGNIRVRNKSWGYLNTCTYDGVEGGLTPYRP